MKKRFWVLCVLALLLVMFSLLAPALMPHDPNATSAAAIRIAPCSEYPLGTDNLGRCVLSRVLDGAGPSIMSALLLVVLTAAFGSLLGALCGYFGGVLDAVLMRLTDLLLAFPQMVVAIAVAGVLSGGMVSVLIALGFTAWTSYARLARSQVLSLRSMPFMQAAKISGASHWQILRSHVLPNMMGPLVVNAAVQLGQTMMGIAGLSFLGLGVQAPQAEWGSMIREGCAYLQLAPWAVLAPGTATVVTVMIFNWLGDAARDLMAGKERI